MNVANKITIARLFIPVVFLPALLGGMPYGHTLAFVLFVAGTATDWLDGYLARRYGMTSDFGRLMDPVADKVLVSAALVGFVVAQPAIVKAWMVVAIIARDLLINGLRLLAMQHHEVVAADTIGKHKTAWQMAGILAVLLYSAYQDFAPKLAQPAADWVGAHVPTVLSILFHAIVVLTFVSGGRYLWKYRKLYMRDV